MFLYPAHVFFWLGLLMTFEFFMLSFVAHEFLFFLKKTAYSWLLSLSCFYFLLTFFLARLLMPFEFLMLSVVAHEFYVFIYKGYSWLLSFSCFCFLLTFLNKATHARFFFDSKATHAFWVSHVVICCSWVVFFMKAAHDFWVSHVFISCSFFKICYSFF